MSAVHRCKRCNLPVKWVTTTHEKSQALDPIPSKDGTVAIVAGLGVTLTKPQRDAHDGDLWMPHAATCPKGRPAPKVPPAGLSAITGLSFVDEADRLARVLIRCAAVIVKRDPDEADCRVAWRYFVAQNPGIDPKVRPFIGPRVRQLIAARTPQREQANA